MNKSPLPRILLAILAVIAAGCLYLTWSYTGKTKQIRDLQRMTTTLNARQQLFGMLVNDCAEYAKRNPAMDQLLRSITVPQQLAAPAAHPPTR